MRDCARLTLLLLWPLLLWSLGCERGFEEPEPFDSRLLPDDSDPSSNDVDAAPNANSIDSTDTSSVIATEVPLAHGCNINAGYSFEAKRFETSGTESIRVVGIYQAGQAGEFSLHVAEPGRFTLVLTAHESVRWNITVGSHTEITRVIATGYHDQQVVVDSSSLPSVVTTAHEDGERVLSGVSRWPDPERQCEDEMPTAFCADFGGVWQQEIRRTHHLLSQLAEELELPISGFYGCYDMDSLSMTL